MRIIGVDVGATSTRAGSFEPHGLEPVEVVRVDTPASADDLVGVIAGLCEHLAPFAAVGVGVAGLVDHPSGNLVWMPHLGGGAPLGARLGELTGRPVVVDNDANVAALAEATGGAGVGHRMVLMVTVGTGIGGGLVVGGEIERGRGFLGEIGHLPMNPAGPQCPCGLTGCWERLAAGSALDAAARRIVDAEPGGATARSADREEPAGRHLVEAAATGDAVASQALGEVAAWFGRGLGMLVNAFDPDVIVVGGGVSRVGSAFLEPAIAAMADGISGSAMRAPTPVVTAALGPGAGMAGAAIAARNHGGGVGAPPWA